MGSCLSPVKYCKGGSFVGSFFLLNVCLLSHVIDFNKVDAPNSRLLLYTSGYFGLANEISYWHPNFTICIFYERDLIFVTRTFSREISSRTKSHEETNRDWF